MDKYYIYNCGKCGYQAVTKLDYCSRCFNSKLEIIAYGEEG